LVAKLVRQRAGATGITPAICSLLAPKLAERPHDNGDRQPPLWQHGRAGRTGDGACPTRPAASAVAAARSCPV